MLTPVIILNSSPATWRRGPDAGRRHVDLARIGLGVGDELGNGLGRNRWMYLHDVGRADDARDRRDVADEIEIELVVERRVDRIRRTDQQQRIAVRRRTHDRLGADIAGGARPVLDDEGLAEPLRQPLAHQTCDDVARAAGGKTDDDAHRPRRIGLRPRDARQSRERRQRLLRGAEIDVAQVSTAFSRMSRSI